ncbi:MAG: hypothetical protein RL748_1971 [Pseudomonadota bacterium]
MNLSDYETIANDPGFVLASKKKTRVLWILMLAFLAYYFALLIGAAYFRSLFATILFGHFNLGMVFAVSQYFFAGAIALYYARYMQQVDASMQQIVATHSKK